MALAKSMLAGMGLTDEQTKAILEGHKESLDHYQEEANTAKAQYEEAKKQLEKVQKDLDALKADAEKNEGKNPWKTKYDALKEEFDNYKADADAKALRTSKEEAYKAILKECGVADKRIGAVVKVADIDSIELEEDGKIKDAETLKASIKEEWSDFITTEGTTGAQTSTPPANVGGKRSKEEIMNIKDTEERQQAMLENKDLFL